MGPVSKIRTVETRWIYGRGKGVRLDVFHICSTQRPWQARMDERGLTTSIDDALSAGEAQ